MKKLHIPIFILCLFAFNLHSYAQCPNDNTLSPSGNDLTPTGQGNTQTNCCIWAGEYSYVNVNAGVDYRFSTCSSPHANDTYITLRKDSDGSVQDWSNMNECGMGTQHEEIDLTAGFTGQLNVLVDDGSCMHNATNHTLSVTQLTALPVEITFFHAHPTSENSIQIEWGTNMEVNNDYFEIYRSTNGVDFHSIGIENGAGNSFQKLAYQYEDYDILPNRIYYYILRQYDFDGSYEDTYTVSALLKNSDLFYLGKIAPNPAQNITYIELNATESAIQVSILDASGKIQSTQVHHPKNSGYNKLSISLSEITTSGIYFLLFESGNEKFTKRLLVYKK